MRHAFRTALCLAALLSALPSFAHASAACCSAPRDSTVGASAAVSAADRPEVASVGQLAPAFTLRVFLEAAAAALNKNEA